MGFEYELSVICKECEFSYRSKFNLGDDICTKIQEIESKHKCLFPVFMKGEKVKVVDEEGEVEKNVVGIIIDYYPTQQYLYETFESDEVRDSVMASIEEVYPGDLNKFGYLVSFYDNEDPCFFTESSLKSVEEINF